MPELKPCPFCNGFALLVEDIISAKYKSNKGGSVLHPYSQFYVKCSNIDCLLKVKTQFMFNTETAIEAWNTRSDNA